MSATTVGTEIELRNASVRFGTFQAVHPTNLRIDAGEFFSILGPSGCGKTTLLRLLSGFLDPTEGDVRIGSRSMLGIGPSDRPTALIFQNLALFPLMTIWENVAFGLEMRGWTRTRRRERSMELLATVALSDHAEKVPAQLSGGQKQRVAIARALAVEPSVLLLDEPLSALDLKLRQHMRAELKQIQARTGITFVYITHDQGEALTMSDRIAVMNEGRISQIGTPDEVYDHPENAFAATFVGEMNVIPGRVGIVADGFARVDTPLGQFRARDPRGLSVGSEALLMVRPERLRLVSGATEAENSISAVVERRDLEGAYSTLTLSAKDRSISVHLPHQGGDDRTAGQVLLGFDAAAALVLPQGDLAHD